MCTNRQSPAPPSAGFCFCMVVEVQNPVGSPARLGSLVADSRSGFCRSASLGLRPFLHQECGSGPSQPCRCIRGHGLVRAFSSRSHAASRLPRWRIDCGAGERHYAAKQAPLRAGPGSMGATRKTKREAFFLSLSTGKLLYRIAQVKSSAVRLELRWQRPTIVLRLEELHGTE
jgi:hypothetical protein